MQPRNKRFVSIVFLSTLMLGTAFVVFAGTTAEISAEKAVSFHYDPRGKIDPFRPLIRKELPVQKKSPTAMSPLQRYNIEQLKLIGIMTGDKKRVAIVSDPRGKSYVISQGTMIGQNNGRVAGILNDQVIVEERTSEDSKKVKIKRIILNLHRVEPEGRL
jgi:Tfp pilus assembly protein PilP